ncbi:MAG: hypothetical protein ABNH26_08685 [Celeribacter sp.]|jgi:hypothetical protein
MMELSRSQSFGLELDMPLDAGIARHVHVLREAGLATIESCEGGPGHCFPEPTVRIKGDHAEGFKAYSVALQHGLKPRALARIWHVEDGELNGPVWDLIFQTEPA